VQRKRNKRNAPELFDFKQKGGGEMGGGPAFSAVRDRGRFWFSLFVLAAVFTLMFREPAIAQEVPACAPAIARVVSLQGDVQVQRGGAGSWSSVRRLDTTVCANDRLRVASLSRAVLFVQPETLVRLDQSTTISLRQTAEETHVEVHADELATGSQVSQCCGAVYLITRFPKKFKVTTPHMNAAVEGTEFMVEASREESKLTVIEGAVSSESLATGDKTLVSAGHSVASGPGGASAIATVVKPQDAVQWVLRYPPISDGSNASRAEELLRAGSIDEALSEIDSVLSGDPNNSDAQALRAIIQVAKNDKAAALASAVSATTANSANYRAWLAMSYGQQANFNLEEALESSLKAASLQPESALAHSRVAELHLSLGDLRRAEEAARAAVASNPAESHAHSILGFVQLAQIDTASARMEFQAAIDRDSFSGLPRLGLGLALIRDGKLVKGREQIEIAVALDPSNSLLRSYVGKAYYEENTRARNELAQTQFGLAKDLDDRDPTPYFYEAILQQSMNRPVASIESLGASIEMNDNRAVYRSRLQLDDDIAARSASLSALYGELGFGKLAILESTKAIAENPGNYSAHNLLAASYANLPRHDIARVSEVLQAQIRQPVSYSSSPPALGIDNLTILRETGPTQLGVNEFNELFTRDGVRFDIDALAGSRDTFGDQAQIGALAGKWSATVGQLHYETDGFVDNEAADKDIYTLLVQRQIGWNSSIQLDVRRNDFTIEETFFRFNPDGGIPVTISENGNSYRMSGQFGTQNTGDWIWTTAYEDPFRLVECCGGIKITDVDSDTYTAEVQNTSHWGAIRAVSGFGYIEKDNFSALERIAFRTNAANAYVYGQWTSTDSRFRVDAGLAADWYLRQHSDVTNSVSRERVSPKVALTWLIRPNSTLRLAAFSAVRRPFVASQTIEPTQVAGFNQYFSGFEDLYGDVEGTISDRIALAFDHSFSEELKAGLEVARRQLDVPSINLDRDFSWRESTGYAYLYKTVPHIRRDGWSAVVTAEGEFETIDRPQSLTGSEGIVDLETIRLPLGVRFFHGGGITIRVQGTHVRQSGTFAAGATSTRISMDDSAWIADAAIDYQLPRRRGIVTLGVLNIGDEFIDLVESDVFNPRVATRRFAFLRVKLNY
jgi:Tfp pilus assembly protein PilF